MRATSSDIRSPRLQLAFVALACFVVWAGFGAILPYLPVFLREEAGASVKLIGVIAGAHNLGALLFASPLGSLSDRIGRRPVLLGGLALYSVSTILFITTTHPGWFILFRFLEGVAAGAVIPAGQAFVADITTESTRSRAFGWLTSAQFGGLVAGPALAIPLYALGGGQGLWAFYSIFIFGSALAAVTFFGLAVVLREPPHVRRDQDKGVRPPYRQLVNRPIIAFLIVAATSHFAMGSWEVVWSLWLRELGASMRFVGLTWMAFSLPMLLAFLGGRLADRYSRFVLMYSGYLVVSGIWVIYGMSRHLWLFLVLAVVEGLATAVAIPAKQAFLVQVSPPRWIGAIQGLEASVLQLAALVGTLLAPLLYEWIAGGTIAVGGLVAIAGLAVTAPVLSREWRRFTGSSAPAPADPSVLVAEPVSEDVGAVR
jgi:MFS family permease